MSTVEQGPPAPGPGQDADFDPSALSKELLHTVRTATLATLTADGAPFATLTTIGLAPDGAPVLLLSRLAAHTQNLERDPRLSLLLSVGGRGDPLAHPRLTLTGTAAPTTDPAARARYLRRNPKAALYAGFADFSFWRADLESVHLNGGFARAANFEPKWLLTPLDGAETLLAAEEDALAHLNAEHESALARLATAAGAPSSLSWRAVGLDPEGLDLTAAEAAARIAFPRRVATPEALRETIIEMLKRSA